MACRAAFSHVLIMPLIMTKGHQQRLWPNCPSFGEIITELEKKKKLYFIESLTCVLFNCFSSYLSSLVFPSRHLSSCSVPALQEKTAHIPMPPDISESSIDISITLMVIVSNFATVVQLRCPPNKPRWAHTGKASQTRTSYRIRSRESPLKSSRVQESKNISICSLVLAM